MRGLATGLAVWLSLSLLVGFVGYMAPTGQIKFWLAAKVCDISALVCQFMSQP